MQQAKTRRQKEEAGNTQQASRSKRKKHKKKSHRSHTNLKDGSSRITSRDEHPQIVSQSSDPLESKQNAQNTSGLQLDRSAPQPSQAPRDNSEGLTPKDSFRGRRDQLNWYANWED